MLLEVCANSFQSALNADRAGAPRIELCENLELGGLTPSAALIEKVCRELTIEVFVLIRPREGNFVYTRQEFEQMIGQIELAKSLGCHGVVAGVLNTDQTIDIERTALLIEKAKPLAFTFHRAFDEIKDPLKGLEQLQELGVDRILTSGQKNSAREGIGLLKELLARSGNKLSILPGAGIHPKNVSIFKQHGFSEVHASARSKGDGAVVSEHSDAEIIRSLLKIIR